MTSTDITTSTDTGIDAVEPAPVEQISEQAAPLAELVAATDRPIIDYLDPADLYIGDNIRKKVDLPKGFLDSLTENGNTIAIIAYRREDGVLEVVDGQRRTLGMIKRGVVRAKVEIHPTRAMAEAEAEAVRIIMQFNANEHGERLTPEERLNGIEQLLNLGHSVTKVSKKLGLRNTDEAKAVRVVAKSDTARDLHTSGQLSLEQAMALTEFDDNPAEVDILLRAADRGQFEGTVVRLRERRILDAARAEAGTAWAEQGFEVLTSEPTYAERDTYAPMSALVDAEGVRPTAETITDPTQWAVWLRSVERWRISATGELVDLNSIDWDIEGEPDAEPDAGLVHPDRVEQFIDWHPSYYCRDLDGAGLHRPGQTNTTGSTDTDQAESERKEAERKQAESTKLAITKVCNRAARAATEVRRDFVAGLVGTRKTTPKSAMIWAAKALLANPDMITKTPAKDIAAQLLGMDSRELDDDTTDNRAGVILIGMAMGGMESIMQPRQATPHYWRDRTNSPGEYLYVSDTTGLREYLRLLAELGHTLDDIDSYVLGEMTLEELLAAEAAKVEAAKTTNS